MIKIYIISKNLIGIESRNTERNYIYYNNHKYYIIVFFKLNAIKLQLHLKKWSLWSLIKHIFFYKKFNIQHINLVISIICSVDVNFFLMFTHTFIYFYWINTRFTTTFKHLVFVFKIYCICNSWLQSGCFYYWPLLLTDLHRYSIHKLKWKHNNNIKYFAQNIIIQI